MPIARQVRYFKSSRDKWTKKAAEKQAKKGISLFQEKYPDVVYTYDVTHGMSNLLKRQLATDEIYQNFLEDCHYCRLQIQQTELSFLTRSLEKQVKIDGFHQQSVEDFENQISSDRWMRRNMNVNKRNMNANKRNWQSKN